MRQIILLLAAVIGLSGCAGINWETTSELRKRMKDEGDLYFRDTDAGRMTAENEQKMGKKKLREWNKTVSDDTIICETTQIQPGLSETKCR